MSYFWTGYFYSFGTLDPKIRDPVRQHISAFTLDRYRWMLAQSGLDMIRFRTDKHQTTSLLLLPLVPLIRVVARVKQGGSESVRRQNALTSLLARKLVICALKRD